MRKRLTFAVAALLLVTAGYLIAQTQQPSAAPQPDLKIFKAPAKPNVMVLQSPEPARIQELGLRVTKLHGDHAYGTLVAKINGQWMTVELDSHNALVAH